MEYQILAQIVHSLVSTANAQRVLRLAFIPALEIEIVCCSIASCMHDLSASFILSSSSIDANSLNRQNQTPFKVKRPSATESCTAAAVNPAAEAGVRSKLCNGEILDIPSNVVISQPGIAVVKYEYMVSRSSRFNL